MLQLILVLQAIYIATLYELKRSKYYLIKLNVFWLCWKQLKFVSENSALLAQCKILNLDAKKKNWMNSCIFNKLGMHFSRSTELYL